MNVIQDTDSVYEAIDFFLVRNLINSRSHLLDARDVPLFNNVQAILHSAIFCSERINCHL